MSVPLESSDGAKVEVRAVGDLGEPDPASGFLDDLLGFEEEFEYGFALDREELDVSFEECGFGGVGVAFCAAKLAGSGACPEGDEHGREDGLD